MANFTINGIRMDVPEGTTILEAAKTAGLEIPHYCSHPKLSIAGNCRMCLVEVEKFPKLQIACNTIVTDGMVVKTDTEKVRQAVTGVLEFLLIHHPIDCPICDQAGECGLQIYYMKYGLHKSRYPVEDKVHQKKVQDIGGQIILDAERCILCSRCIRFLQEVTGTGELEFFQRGDHSEISIFPGRPLDNRYTGNLADICPVGALTSKDFRFKCRVWLLRGARSICPGCANGCNVEAHFKEEILYRLKPRQNDEVNKTWMCDPGRLEYKKANEARLLTPVNRENGIPKAAPWEAALSSVAFRPWATGPRTTSSSRRTRTPTPGGRNCWGSPRRSSTTSCGTSRTGRSGPCSCSETGSPTSPTRRPGGFWPTFPSSSRSPRTRGPSPARRTPSCRPRRSSSAGGHSPTTRDASSGSGWDSRPGGRREAPSRSSPGWRTGSARGGSPAGRRRCSGRSRSPRPPSPG